MTDISATGDVSNTTSYSLAVQSSSLTFGKWVLQPQPVPPGPVNATVFSAVPVVSTSLSVAGNVVYDVTASGASVGTCTLTFDDAEIAQNSAGFSTTVAGLSATCECPKDGSAIQIQWTLSTS